MSVEGVTPPKNSTGGEIDYPASIKLIVESDKVWFDLAANVLTTAAFWGTINA
jgi:hypothetical protein